MVIDITRIEAIEKLLDRYRMELENASDSKIELKLNIHRATWYKINLKPEKQEIYDNDKRVFVRRDA